VRIRIADETVVPSALAAFSEERVARDVAGRPREARDDTAPDGVADIGHDDRDQLRRGCLLRGECYAQEITALADATVERLQASKREAANG
jgi:hypothetical protein